MMSTISRALIGLTTIWLAGMAGIGAATRVQDVAPARPQPDPAVADRSAAPDHREFLNRYCTTCHNDRLKTAQLSLQAVDVARVDQDAPVWEKVLRKLRARAMPPVGRPRPDATAYSRFTSWLETELDRASAAQPNPGRIPTFHRLNRVEYQNAIRDILGLEIDTTSLLPGDDAAFGFDNIGEMLTVSPDLLDRYLSAANRISRLAVGDPALHLGSATYQVSQYLLQNDRMNEDLPFGSRGGAAIRHYFPYSGEYVFTIRFAGVSRPPQAVDLRIDGTPAAELLTSGRNFEDPADRGAVVARVVVKAGPRTVGVSFRKNTLMAESRFPQFFPWGNSATFGTNVGSVRYLNVDTVDIAGPFTAEGPGDTPSRQRIFVCQPGQTREEKACAQKIMSGLARRSYRRPVTDADVDVLLRFYENARHDRGFDGAIQPAVERLLVDPDFLFRVERHPAAVPSGASYRIGDVELASRLSFFLWSSVPDEELLQLVERGELRDPARYERQVRRMLADGRSRSLVTNFASQWLYLRNIRLANPDSFEFPDWDDNLRSALLQETELFLEHQLREDRPIGELLSAKYTFLNERLARHYGVQNVYGNHFRMVPLEDEHRRGGLLGQGSILLVTSFANRTSPVLRGKWLLENFLNYTPPAPPPDVPDLPPVPRGQRARSMREQVEQHRANAVCAACHSVMDPLGFALENYDAIGRFRATTNGSPIDASGTTPDGIPFDGLAGLRHVIEKRGDDFVLTVAEKLMTYALGRGLEYYDQPVLRRIVREAAPGDYRWSSIILGITRSVPFHMNQKVEP
jgi:hypothetical protein